MIYLIWQNVFTVKERAPRDESQRGRFKKIRLLILLKHKIKNNKTTSKNRKRVGKRKRGDGAKTKKMNLHGSPTSLFSLDSVVDF